MEIKILVFKNGTKIMLYKSKLRKGTNSGFAIFCAAIANVFGIVLTIISFILAIKKNFLSGIISCVQGMSFCKVSEYYKK